MSRSPWRKLCHGLSMMDLHREHLLLRNGSKQTLHPIPSRGNITILTCILTIDRMLTIKLRSSYLVQTELNQSHLSCSPIWTSTCYGAKEYLEGLSLTSARLPVQFKLQSVFVVVFSTQHLALPWPVLSSNPPGSAPQC